MQQSEHTRHPQAPQRAADPHVVDENLIMVGDMVLHLALRTVHSHSLQTVKLSGNEFLVLAKLAERADQHVSTSDLLVAITGSPDGAHPSVIDLYIKYLHRRLQEAETSATIERGDNGFRLRP